MLVVQNLVKKGIEIPEIEVTIAENEREVLFSGIDTVKYLDWLEFRSVKVAYCFFVQTNGNIYMKSVGYEGIDITIQADNETDIVTLYGVNYNYFASY